MTPTNGCLRILFYFDGIDDLNDEDNNFFVNLCMLQK